MAYLAFGLFIFIIFIFILMVKDK